MRKPNSKIILASIVVIVILLFIYNTDVFFKKQRILCLILTTNDTIENRGVAVWETWAGKCDKALFACNCRTNIKEKSIIDIPILKLNIIEGYNQMANKVLTVLKLAYQKYINDFDFFLLADDDTFILVDNLKIFVSNKSKEEPLTYGYNYKVILENGYHSGGAGVLFTHESLKRFGRNIEKGICNTSLSDGFGDLAIGICSEKSKVKMGISLDQLGRERFHPSSLKVHYQNPKDLESYSQNKPKNGTECCSEETISFHYVSANEMYTYSELLKYDSRVHVLFKTL